MLFLANLLLQLCYKSPSVFFRKETELLTGWIVARRTLLRFENLWYNLSVLSKSWKGSSTVRDQLSNMEEEVCGGGALNQHSYYILRTKEYWIVLNWDRRKCESRDFCKSQTFLGSFAKKQRPERKFLKISLICFVERSVHVQLLYL